MTKFNHFGARSNKYRYMLLASAALVFGSTTALGQEQAVEEIVVTGTSIRGVAPVGFAITSVNQEDIKATGATAVQGILASMPQLMGMGTSGNGQTGQNAQQAIIHQFGASASTSTLTLVDGHRFALSGTNHSFADANLLPINMIERVEVVADGVSAVYGSDAVAGVVNFITRSRFDGVQLQGSAAFADGKKDYNLGLLTGRNWTDGGAIFGYSYTRQGQLMSRDRPFTNPNHIVRGGSNQGNFNCDPATLQPAGSSVIYTSATSGATLANAAVNAPCSGWSASSLIPQTTRHNAMVKVRQDFGDNWTVKGDLLYSLRRVRGATSRGTLTGTAFRTGAQANPFYVTPAGYTGAATSSNVRWSADALLGPGAESHSGSDNVFAHFDVEYRFRGWTFNLVAMQGRDDSYVSSHGTLNSSVATLALNGTTNTGGITTQPVANTNIILNQFPLTAANALDVWNPAGTNRTSAAVRAMLIDNESNSHVENDVSQINFQAQGTVFELPAGPVKLALGLEAQKLDIYEYLSQAQGSGPASNASVYRSWRFDRQVQSAFAETNIPVISPSFAIPFVQQVDFNFSLRHDKYNDFGKTTNPKVAGDWRINDDFKVRANWSKSFVAPPADELGEDGTWNNTNYNPYPTVNTSVQVALFPTLAQMGIPGCTATSVTCNIGALQGLRVTRGDPKQSAAKGEGYSFGFDYTPSYLPGLRANVTRWSSKVRGGSTGPAINYISRNNSLKHLMTFYPNCATPAEINEKAYNLPLVGAVAPCTQYIVTTLNSSWLNLHAQGVDATVDYRHATETAGVFSVGGSLSLSTKFNQSLGDGEVFSVQNTTGSNSFPSIGLQSRTYVGWTDGPFDARMFFNYTGRYKNWGTPVNPVISDPISGTPQGGGDRVKANLTVDLSLSYEFKGGAFGDSQLGLQVRNLLDKDPPFYNSGSGFDGNASSPVGRLITIGLTTTF